MELTTACQVFYANNEPQTTHHAMQDPMWSKAINAELQALAENGTSYVVTLPRRCIPIRCKWLFNIKRNVDSSVGMYKSRPCREMVLSAT